jgi:hypothetical protein
MGYYENVYLKRLNRYGIDFQTRIQGQREENFRRQLLKSVYYVNFEYDGRLREGELTPMRQNETKTMHYLLTDVHLDMPGGTILMMPDKDWERVPWMVYYLEDYVASGYNRYIMIKMTHYLTWKNREGEECNAWAYFYGQEDNMLKDELKSRSRSSILYNENLKLSFFICPVNNKIKKEDYFEVSITDKNDITSIESYRVTGYDKISTPGIEFVSVDPVYRYDHTPAPTKEQGDKDEDFFWLDGDY